MKREEFFKAVGEMDDSLISSADAPACRKEKPAWKNWVLAAACIALAAGAIFPFAKAAAEGRSWLSVLMPDNEKYSLDIPSDDCDALPSLTWEENCKGLSPYAIEIIEWDGAYYQGLNMSDKGLLDQFNLPHEIYSHNLQEAVGNALTDNGKKLTLYQYMPDQQAVYIAECEGKYTFAVFCNRIRADLSLYDTVQALFEIYGIHDVSDIHSIMIGNKKMTDREAIDDFYHTLTAARGMGNAEWNTIVFDGMSEKESNNLCIHLADTMQEISITSTRGIRANGLKYYPTIRYVEWAINYYRLEKPIG